MEFIDKSLSCRDCGGSFIWSAGEQAFFKDKALTNMPVRCAQCRSARKAKLGLPARTQSWVKCAKCYTSTTVPFVPRNGTPVYCAACFTAIREQREEAAAPLAEAVPTH